MNDFATRRRAARAGASLMALVIASVTTAAAAQSTAAPASVAQMPPRPSTSNVAPTQTAPVGGPGIANSTVPNNEMVSAPQTVVTRVPDPVNEGEVLVVGVRQAEASAIERKRTARTAQDSIVADDVGQFPDKNAAEAIARIAGVALDVGDDGQQGGFTIRGQAADLIRVEVDGMTALPANGDNGGRAVGISDISSDLIKSVDVVKGQTADMTPGGVGGTVRIEQRNGLDFKKPLYRLNVQGRQDTLNGRWAPRINAVVAGKFFGDDLGLLFNGTYEQQRLTTDFARVSNKQAGYLPLGDHDNSPEKSFTTPFDPVAAAVTTKAGCAALTDSNTIRSRLNCYAQWEDFLPSLPRYGRGVRDDKRLSLQVRADWRATRNLTLFASYNPNIRHYSSQDFNLSVAAPSGTTNSNGAISTNITNVQVNANHYVTQYDMVRGTGNGTVSALNWSSQVRDLQRDTAQHYGQAGADWLIGRWTIKARAQYSYAKAEREDEAFTFNAALPSARFNLVPENGLWNISVPSTIDLSSPQAYYPVLGSNGRSATSQLEYTPFADKNSEWNFQFDVARQFVDFGPLTQLKFGAQRRTRDNQSYRHDGSTISPGVVLSSARSLDLLQYCVPSAAPSTMPCVFGSARRNTSSTASEQLSKIHNLTQEQYQEIINASLITLPGRNFFSGLPGRGSLIDSWSGYDAKVFFDTLSKYADLSAHNPNCLYECIASDGKTYKRPTYDTTEKTFSAYAMADFEMPIFDARLDGNIGVRYQRIGVDAEPVINFANRVAVPTTNSATGLPGYTITDVFTSRQVGQVKRTSEDWLPSLNLALWAYDTLALRYSIALQRARPSIQQLTGSSAVTCGKINDADRAALEALLATNPGAIDDGNPDTDDEDEAANVIDNFVNRCGGRIGNPELKGYGALTQNLSLEWYPNRQTQLTAAVYSIDVRSGRPEGDTIPQYSLNDTTYQVSTYRDGPSGLKTTGFEIAGRTAFTFLPSFLKYLGGGFNYSYSRTNEKNTAIDLFSRKALPPRGQSAYYYNVNAWYDDGRLNARIAYQARANYYDRTESDGINRIPAGFGVDDSGASAYFKMVSPIFKTAVKTIDARASYKLNDMFQLFVEGKNLTDNAYTRYTTDRYRKIDDKGTPYVYDTLFSGRTYYIGAIATF
ncbi:TonB-dependent receptor [uncultured Sphingomonas sp.]|uniref:TonB-dependent receptor n=1 Tax=uncultured Sphingomonas sp. TaxID=158754 RepID=UPI0026009A40|nr:TonB-dependent receptor [uncultured Sphingomonas sp.]